MTGRPRVVVHYHADGSGAVVLVPTEYGTTVHIDIAREGRNWVVKVSDEFVWESPQAIAAGLGIAFSSLRPIGVTR